MWDRVAYCGGRGTVNDFVGIINAEVNHVAILQLAAFHLFAIYKEASALAAIFDVILVGLDDDRGAVARNAAVGELQVVAGFGAAANEKRRLGHAHKSARAVRRNNL